MDELQCVKVQIKLDTVDKVKTFSERAAVCPLDLDILQKRYIIDAKSVLGIFSCDLSQELTLVIHDGDKKEVEKFKQFIETFKC